MGIFKNFERQEMEQLPEGNYALLITDAKEEISKTGKNMLVFQLQPLSTNLSIRHNLVDSEYINAYITQFMDCFSIPDGNRNPNNWSGCKGVAKLSYNDAGYLEVSKFYLPAVAKELKIRNGELPF